MEAHELLGMSLHFGNGQPEKKNHNTPSTSTRQLDQPPSHTERGFEGMNTDEIARKCFQSIKFNANHTTVLDGHVYQQLNSAADDRLKQCLFTLFGVRLTVEALDRNIDNLELNDWGRLENIQDTEMDLSKKVIHAKIAEVALLACASLSPAIVSTVTSVLSSLSDSLQSIHSILKNTVIDANLFTTDTQSIVLVNSRFAVLQVNQKWMLWLCGFTRQKMVLRLSIRRIGFTTAFTDGIRTDSPLIRRKIDKRVLLPPSPEFSNRSMTAPSSVPSRMKHSSRASMAQQQMIEMSSTPENSNKKYSPILLPSRSLKSVPEEVKESPVSVMKVIRPH